MEWINRKYKEPNISQKYILVFSTFNEPWVLKYEGPSKWNEEVGGWVTDESLRLDFDYWLPIPAAPNKDQI